MTVSLRVDAILASRVHAFENPSAFSMADKTLVRIISIAVAFPAGALLVNPV
jgi:hypothetical protein